MSHRELVQLLVDGAPGALAQHASIINVEGVGRLGRAQDIELAGNSSTRQGGHGQKSSCAGNSHLLGSILSEVGLKQDGDGPGDWRI